MMNQVKEVRAFAPATSANLAVGFDILGFAVDVLGDEVRLLRSEQPGLRLVMDHEGRNLPVDLDKNTASVALKAMMVHLGIEQGFDLHLDKKIPLSSGLGGSAASAVAAVVALNGFLKKPLSLEELLPFALTGEEVASGARHGDNVVPCLYGGLQLIVSLEPAEIISLPSMSLYAALIRPDWRVNTRDARAALPPYFNLTEVVKQTGYLAGFISALYDKDASRLARCCQDVLVEPRRAHLLPYFYEVKEKALRAGALACSISGSGPVIFALAENEKAAREIASVMVAAYDQRDIDAQMLVSPVGGRGAEILESIS